MLTCIANNCSHDADTVPQIWQLQHDDIDLQCQLDQQETQSHLAMADRGIVRLTKHSNAIAFDAA